MVSRADEKKITKIIERVDRKELVFQKRTAIMDKDYNDYWRMDEFVPPATMGIGQQNAITTNFPFLLADKVQNTIAYAERVIRVEDDADNREFRDQNNAYERWAIGALELGDKRLEESGMKAKIQAQNGWNATVRGAWIATRALLTKDADKNTIVDIVPFDSRNVLFEPGVGEPLWAAVVTQRSKHDIRDEYPKFKFTDEVPAGTSPDDDNDENVRVIDYYFTEKDKDAREEDTDEESETFGEMITVAGRKHRMNAVIIDKQFAKPATDTFSENFPIVIRMIGNSPPVMNFTLKDDIQGVRDIPGIEELGPSVFAPLRLIVRNINLISSAEMALTSKAVQGTLKVFSRDGLKELDQDAFASGSELNLSTDNQEDAKLLEIAQTTKDAVSLGAKLGIDMLNAGLSEQRFGRLTAPVSGAALNIIGQADNERIAPFLKPVESMIAGIIDNIGKQYETGRYKEIQVRGKTHSDLVFNRVISPEDIEGHGLLSVELVQFQPHDDVALWAAAKTAATIDPATGQQLVSDRYAATKIARVQDYDLEERRKANARIKTSAQKYELLVQWHAARLEGEEETVQMLEIDIQRILDREEMEEQALLFAFKQSMEEDPVGTSAAGVGGSPNGRGGGGGGSTNGGNPATINADPRVAANAGRPGVSREPSPDAGFNTTAPRGGGPDAAGLERNI